jgi:hypothetical protein
VDESRVNSFLGINNQYNLVDRTRVNHVNGKPLKHVQTKHINSEVLRYHNEDNNRNNTSKSKDRDQTRGHRRHHRHHRHHTHHSHHRHHGHHVVNSRVADI